MNIQQQIDQYISTQPVGKQKDMQVLHQMITELMPGTKLWFLDGKNSENKVVSNPNIGYGTLTMNYADGTSREFYNIGISANTSGISVYIMGIEDKKYLVSTYSDKIGKASVTSYCIKFKSLKDINLDVLKKAIRDGIG